MLGRVRVPFGWFRPERAWVNQKFGLDCQARGRNHPKILWFKSRV
jgi:hypothetical protein